jgi:outer membrane protein assembly factor BamB
MIKRILKLIFIYLLVFGGGYFLTGMVLSAFKKKVVVSPNFGISDLKNNLWKEQVIPVLHHQVIDYQLFGDTINNNEKVIFTDDYASKYGVFCFRGNPQRNSPTRGLLTNRPKGIKVLWEFETELDNRKTNFGSWGGGTGWTGQPLLVKWPQKTKEKLAGITTNFRNDKAAIEVVVGSLCGKIYFLDFLTGKITRPALSINNPIKGTVSVDPRMNGLLYVGQGIPNGGRFGSFIFDMFSGKEIFYRSGLDKSAHRKWGAFDSNPLIDPKTGYWFQPAENGQIYKTKVTDQFQIGKTLKFNYSIGDNTKLGIESSFAAWNNLGFFGDNSGNVFCVDLMTLKPIWHINNYDDTDASMVIDMEDKQPFLYIANEVDQQGDVGTAYIRKINALTGKEIWAYSKTCFASKLGGKTNSGGVLATLLIGKQQASKLVYGIYSRTDKMNHGEFVAINKKTGKVVYTIPMDNYSWASPIDLYDKEGNCYVFFTDVYGTIYLIDGLTGKIIIKEKMDAIWESSPVAWGNKIILGSRGNKIFGFQLY